MKCIRMDDGHEMRPTTVRDARAKAVMRRAMTRAISRAPIVHHGSYSAPVMPPGHRFPMGVFQRVRDTCEREGLLERGVNEYAPMRAPTREELCAAHSEAWVEAVMTSSVWEKARREIGLPWCGTRTRRTRTTDGHGWM